MNDLTKKLTDNFTPFMAIIAYKAGQADKYYLEQRRISKGKMSAGAPLKEKTISKIVSAIAVTSDDIEEGIRGVIPENLLFCDSQIGRTKLVWYRPPEKRSVYFSPKVGIEDGIMKVPGLLYVVSGNILALYAFKGRKPKGKLYMAPFMNVDTSHVCLGNAKIEKPKERTYANLMSYWESLFWQSEFSHILGANPIKGNLASITKECIETGCDFPTDLLIPIQQKLKDFLK